MARRTFLCRRRERRIRLGARNLHNHRLENVGSSVLSLWSIFFPSSYSLPLARGILCAFFANRHSPVVGYNAICHPFTTNATMSSDDHVLSYYRDNPFSNSFKHDRLLFFTLCETMRARFPTWLPVWTYADYHTLPLNHPCSRLARFHG